MKEEKERKIGNGCYEGDARTGKIREGKEGELKESKEE